MPAPTTTTTSPPLAGDDLDDLFNYDVHTDDVFRDYHPAMDAPARNPSPERPKATDLGIDEEIQVAKKRKPIAKLDEHRLLSQAGIPKLRHITKERLRFKGKGHEYADVARLLNVYQLWLDDLYPRAKFADGLAMIEKLGHTKRLQTMRREWIREGRPVERRGEEGSSGEGAAPPSGSGGKGVGAEGEPAGRDMNGTHETALRPSTNEQGSSKPQSSKEESLFVSDDEADLHPSDDELDALLAEEARNTASTATAAASAGRKHNEADLHPPEDDLDALLAEDTFNTTRTTTGAPKPSETHDEFEDEMEAMAGMDDTW